MELTQHIELLKSRLAYYMGEHEKIKEERKSFQSYKKWAEARILNTEEE